MAPLRDDGVRPAIAGWQRLGERLAELDMAQIQRPGGGLCPGDVEDVLAGLEMLSSFIDRAFRSRVSSLPSAGAWALVSPGGWPRPLSGAGRA
jgi:hypothetical protein